MMVVDTNIIAYFFIPGQMTSIARSVALRDPDWIVPSLWRREFRNVLTLYLRRGEFDLPMALYLMNLAEALLEKSERSVDSGDVLQLAAESKCSACDCEFVALARRLNVPLVTNDRGILANFPLVAVKPDTFSKPS